jgi:signal peptidase I
MTEVEVGEPDGESAVAAVGGFFWELIKVVIIAAVIIIPIRYFLVQPFFVRGASMEPTYSDGEYLIIDQLSYRMRDPRRGEVIVFRFPDNHSQFFIKRIIGLPGETVTIADGQVTIVNKQYQQGASLNESEYLGLDLRTGGQITTTLAEDEFFVLGDNRFSSSDSRSWGPLSRGEIVGRSLLRAFPFNRAEVFDPVSLGFVSI